VNAVKVRHNTRLDPQSVKQQLGISVKAWDDFMYQLKQLSERKVKTADMRTYFQRVFNDPATRMSEPVTKSSELTLRQAVALFEGLGRGAELPSAKGTAYGLVNAVTELVDRHLRAGNVENRLDSPWYGTGAAIKKRALNEV